MRSCGTLWFSCVNGTRPPTPLIVDFIDAQRTKGRAAASVCQVLREQGVQIAARSYRAMKTRQASARDQADAVVVDALLATVDTPKGMYGRRKMVSHLRRTGYCASARQIDRFMRELRMNRLIRGCGIRTTTPDKSADRAPDLLERDVTALSVRLV